MTAPADVYRQGPFAQDYSVDRIAERLVISIGTVRTHKKRIYAKVGVHEHEDLMRAIRAPQGRG